MPNVLYTAPQVAQVMAALVTEESFLSALISRNFENDLLGGGGKGRTVNIKVPNALVARARGIDDTTNAIVLDYIAEVTRSITLGVHAYSAVGLSEGDLSLDLTNFADQILAPQATSISAYIEGLVREALLAEVSDATLAGKWTQETPVKFFTALRKKLRDDGVPASGLQVVVGTGVYAGCLDAALITDATQSGSTSALREGNIGKLRGFTIVEDADIPENAVIAFHRDAYTLAVRAPKKPEGASFGATISDHGFPLRYLRDYDARYTQDRSIVSTFAGIAKMPLYRIDRTNTKLLEGDVDTDGAGPDLAYTVGTATVTEIAAGAVVRADVTLA